MVAPKRFVLIVAPDHVTGDRYRRQEGLGRSDSMVVTPATARKAEGCRPTEIHQVCDGDRLYEDRIYGDRDWPTLQEMVTRIRMKMVPASRTTNYVGA